MAARRLLLVLASSSPLMALPAGAAAAEEAACSGAHPSSEGAALLMTRAGVSRSTPTLVAGGKVRAETVDAAFAFVGLLDKVESFVSEDGQAAKLSFVYSGREHHFKLQASVLFTPTAKIITYTSEGRLERAPGPTRVFESRPGDAKRAMFYLGADGSVSGLFRGDGGAFMSVDPVRHSDNKEALALLGKGGHRSRNTHFMQRTNWTGEVFYPDCFAGDQHMYEFTVGFGATLSSYEKYGEAMEPRVLQSIAKASFIYQSQVHLKLVADYLVIVKARRGAPKWARQRCNGDENMLNPVLGSMDGMDDAGAMAVFDSCGSPGGTVGLGYMDTICTSVAQSVTKLHSSDGGFATLAHEIGHNWGLRHGGNGGIMSFEKELNGVVQFNVNPSRRQLCQSIAKNKDDCAQWGYLRRAGGGAPEPGPAPVPPTAAPTPSPTVAPTAPPDPDALFATTGPCEVVGKDCVQSPNYPDKYASNQECDIMIAADKWANKAIDVVDFQTELDYDVLVVNGEQYHGDVGPQGATPAGALRWSSDASEEARGWKLCGVDKGSVTTQPPPVQHTLFAVVEGGCQVVGLHSHCVQSPNYPRRYRNSEFCRISVGGDWTGKHIEVEQFKTEKNFDYLTVNGERYAGRRGPEGVMPTTDLEWVSDDSKRGKGWKICAVDVSPVD